MTDFRLRPSEGEIIASGGMVQIRVNRGRCRELILDQHFVRVLARAQGLIDQFYSYVLEGIAYETMFGETPSQEVLDGKKLLNRPMLSLAKAGGDKYWFGYSSKPTGCDWRHRQRVLVSMKFLSMLGGVVEEHLSEESEKENEEDLFWLIRGKLEDGIRNFTFNSVSALVEYNVGKWLGIKRVDAPIWDGLAEMAAFIHDCGPDGVAEGFIPEPERPEFTARVEASGEEDVSLTLYWNGFVQLEETISVDVLIQISRLVCGMWPRSLDHFARVYQVDVDDDDDDEEGSVS